MQVIDHIEQDIMKCVEADFPASEVSEILEVLRAASGRPRIQRCIVFAARGHRSYFEYLCRLVAVDERDVIMAAEYDRLNVRLYDFNCPIGAAKIERPFGPASGDIPPTTR
jgi:hypothetical protein